MHWLEGLGPPRDAGALHKSFAQQARAARAPQCGRCCGCPSERPCATAAVLICARVLQTLGRAPMCSSARFLPLVVALHTVVHFMHGGAGRQCQPLCSRSQKLAEHRRVAPFFAWQSRAAVPAPALISSPLQRCKACGASGPVSAHTADPSRGPAKSAYVCRSIARLLMCTVPGAQKKAEHKSEQALFHEVLLGGRRPAA